MQHQIINGEKTSLLHYLKWMRVLILVILYQKEFSLDGDLDDIYKRVSDIGTDGVIEILEDGYQNQIKQNEEEATFTREESVYE